MPSTDDPPAPVALSAIVCTFDRCAKLALSLDALAAAAPGCPGGMEIVVVDNNSRDATAAVVAGFARGCPVPVRYVVETAQGLSFARNAGIRAARGEIAAFTDDDCLVDPEWPAAILRAFAADPGVAVVGGRVDLYAPVDRPVSIRPFDRAVRYRSVADVFGLIMGCNMAVRRTAVASIGGFDPAVGGTAGVVADDVDFIYRALRRDLGVLFDPAIRVRHDHGRRTDAAVAALARIYARGRGAFYCKHALRDGAVLREAYWEVRKNLDRAGAGRLRDLAAGALHILLTRARLSRP
ncbi:MAG: glycosyltransferase family 2 protein [Rhodospirillales bacterium]